MPALQQQSQRLSRCYDMLARFMHASEEVLIEDYKGRTCCADYQKVTDFSCACCTFFLLQASRYVLAGLSVPVWMAFASTL